MFSNLRNALYKKDISIKQYAEFLNLNEKSVQNKLKGITDFTYTEFKKTCSLLFPEFNADYLFACDSQMKLDCQHFFRQLF